MISSETTAYAHSVSWRTTHRTYNVGYFFTEKYGCVYTYKLDLYTLSSLLLVVLRKRIQVYICIQSITIINAMCIQLSENTNMYMLSLKCHRLFFYRKQVKTEQVIWNLWICFLHISGITYRWNLSSLP